MTEDRAAKLAAIATEIRHCAACRLHKSANNSVPGYGDVNAEILFIGEAPGFEEDRQGLPFVGRSGRYLDYLLGIIGLKREQVFITNVIKHRPPENRDPQPDELVACKSFIDRQFEIINPLVVVTLGRFSMTRYFPDAKISQIHGRPRYDTDRAYYPMFHPAAALRTPELRHDMEADIRRLPEIVTEAKRRRGQRPTNTQMPPIPDQPDQEPPKQLKLF